MTKLQLSNEWYNPCLNCSRSLSLFVLSLSKYRSIEMILKAGMVFSTSSNTVYDKHEHPKLNKKNKKYVSINHTYYHYGNHYLYGL